MIQELYEKLISLTNQTRETFIKNGQVIPSITGSGNVRFGSFVVIKKENLYEIRDISGQKLYYELNLPETAIIVANSLALGQTPDYQLLKSDREYGFNQFEQTNYIRLIKNRKNKDRLEIFEDRLDWAECKSYYLKQYIQKEFQKICSIF